MGRARSPSLHMCIHRARVRPGDEPPGHVVYRSAPTAPNVTRQMSTHMTKHADVPTCLILSDAASEHSADDRARVCGAIDMWAQLVNVRHCICVCSRLRAPRPAPSCVYMHNDVIVEQRNACASLADAARLLQDVCLQARAACRYTCVSDIDDQLYLSHGSCNGGGSGACPGAGAGDSPPRPTGALEPQAAFYTIPVQRLRCDTASAGPDCRYFDDEVRIVDNDVPWSCDLMTMQVQVCAAGNAEHAPGRHWQDCVVNARAKELYSSVAWFRSLTGGTHLLDHLHGTAMQTQDLEALYFTGRHVEELQPQTQISLRIYERILELHARRADQDAEPRGREVMLAACRRILTSCRQADELSDQVRAVASRHAALATISDTDVPMSVLRCISLFADRDASRARGRSLAHNGVMLRVSSLVQQFSERLYARRAGDSASAPPPPGSADADECIEVMDLLLQTAETIVHPLTSFVYDRCILGDVASYFLNAIFESLGALSAWIGKILARGPARCVSISLSHSVHALLQSLLTLWEVAHTRQRHRWAGRETLAGGMQGMIRCLRTLCDGEAGKRGDRHRRASHLCGGVDAVVPRAPSTQQRPRIVMTITSCKRLHLFRETVCSLLRSWTDFALVDMVVCVDDNSCESDRRAMVAEFPWIVYRMKTADERGHRLSMNVIVNEVLRALKPEYWIQMEDDWFFHKEDAYASRCMRALREHREQGVRQVVLNRHYEEKFDWHDVPESAAPEPAVLPHAFVPGAVPGQTSFGWWPHFSLNPSMIDARVIADECGDFSAPDQGFEMRYAHRYFHGHRYKTAYLNQISCTNIGRLRAGDDAPNAYALNGTAQY